MNDDFQKAESVSMLMDLLKKKVGASAYANWFGKIVIVFEDEQSKVVFLFEGKFALDTVRRDYGDAMEKAAIELFGPSASIECRVDKEATGLMAAAGAANTQDLLNQEIRADFFMPSLADVPGKDEVHLMEIAPFALTKKDSRTTLVYDKLPDLSIEITATEKHGLMTYNDYSFVLMSVSHLNEQANKWRSEVAEWRKKGEVGPMPNKPPRKYRPLVSDFERFLGKRFGGHQYAGIEPMLDRLKTTSAKIKRTGRAYKRVGTFSFIGDYDITVRSAEKQHAIEVEIIYPDWVYDGVVREDRPTLKTFHPDYLSISSSLAGFLYRLAKIKAGNNVFEMPLWEVHHRSGSRQKLKEFNKTLKKLIAKISEVGEGIPEYDFKIEGSARSRYLTMTYRPAETLRSVG